MSKLDTRPNPGSLNAQYQGCICPILDNEFGDEKLTGGYFTITKGCPVHEWESHECLDCEPGPGRPCLPNCPKGVTK